MSDAAPPPWVRQLSLPSGAWRCLVGLWGFARYQTKGQTTVYPCRETLAEQTGQTVHAVAKQLRQLAERGWIHRPGKRGSTKAVLAWAEPFGEDGPVASQDGPPRTEVSPETDGSVEETGRSEVNPGRSDGWTQDGPQTSRELPENFQENVEGDAPATPPDLAPIAPWTEIDRAVFATAESESLTPTRETRPHDRQDHANHASGHHQGSGNPRLRDPGAREDPQPSAPAADANANAHLDTTAQRHADLAAERRKPAGVRSDVAGRTGEAGVLADRDVKPDNRADLSPEVEAAVRAGRMGGQLHGVVWRRCLLEALDDIGVGEDEHAAMVTLVLEHWQNTRPGDKPAKSQVWYRRWRDWQREAMGLGKPKAKSGMSGGIVASRPLPDWDGEAKRRAAQ